uniref:Uncharacterized protein n=1 Tax=Arundo donax TaxID=35708 RepID=A0A0A9C9C5_ARUDO
MTVGRFQYATVIQYQTICLISLYKLFELCPDYTSREGANILGQ